MSTQVHEVSLTPQRQQEFLARVEIEVKYLIQRSQCVELFTQLYVSVHGRAPAKSVKLLDWFFAHYHWDVSRDTWVRPEPYVN